MRYLIILILMPGIQFLTGRWCQEFLPETLLFGKLYIRFFSAQILSILIPLIFVYPKDKFLAEDDFKIKKYSDLVRFSLLGVCLQFIGTALNYPLSLFLQYLGYSLPNSVPPALTGIEFFVQTLVVCLTPAVLEEVLFRRFIYNHIAGYSHQSAIFFSALFFAMAHFDFYNLMATFFIGLTLGVLRSRNISVLLCILIHFTTNLTANLLNVGFTNPFFLELFERYYPLSILFFGVLFFALLPKKDIPQGEQIVLPKPRGKFYRKLLKNPLFYGYCILFIVLGVTRL